MTNIRTYSELVNLKTFKERYRYLKLTGHVGEETFGFDRYLNQKFYKSDEWLAVRDEVIIRDEGCDLGILDRPINRILIHHMNPITKYDIINKTELLLNPEYLICVSNLTHQAIHYGNEELLIDDVLIVRSKNDTCPWRR